MKNNCDFRFVRLLPRLAHRLRRPIGPGPMHLEPDSGRPVSNSAVRVGVRSLVLAGLMASGAVFQATGAAAEDAVASVKRIYTATITAGSAPGLLSARLESSIDFAAVSQKILGEAYRNASAADRRNFDAVLLEVIALELSQKIRNDQEFEILRARKLRGDDVVVFSSLTRSTGSQKLLDWKMRPCGTRYCIYDLLSNNASFSASRRSEYTARLQAAGGSLATLTRALGAEVASRK